MVTRHTLEGYEAFVKFLSEWESKKVTMYFLFTGSPNEKGVSWCPDCVQAEPFIEEVVEQLPDTVHFVKVLVGNREFWKDRNCPFRHDKKVHVTTLPTVLKYGCPQRLEGENFNDIEIIRMAFEDDL